MSYLTLLYFREIQISVMVYEWWMVYGFRERFTCTAGNLITPLHPANAGWHKRPKRKTCRYLTLGLSSHHHFPSHPLLVKGWGFRKSGVRIHGIRHLGIRSHHWRCYNYWRVRRSEGGEGETYNSHIGAGIDNRGYIDIIQPDHIAIINSVATLCSWACNIVEYMTNFLRKW